MTNAIEYFYECKDCQKQYKETREETHPQWFYQCDICGGEYKEIAATDRGLILTPTE